MELTMINNAVNQAKNKLARHRALGKESRLSITEVAKLMDLVTFGPEYTRSNSTPVFFSYSAN